MDQIDRPRHGHVIMIVEKHRHRLVREILKRELYLRHIAPLTNGLAIDVDAVRIHREAVILPAFLTLETQGEECAHGVVELFGGEFFVIGNYSVIEALERCLLGA